MRSQPRRKEILFIIPLTIFFAIIVFIPFIRIIAGSLIVSETKGLGLQNYVKLLTTGAIVRSIKNSFLLSLWSTLIAGVIGFFFAYAISKRRERWRNLLVTINTLPLTISAVVTAYGFLVVFGDSGLVNGFLVYFLNTHISNFFKLLSIGGLIFVYQFFQIPLMTIIVASATSSMDPHIEEAARSVGANKVQIMFKIVIPHLMPAIIAGLSLLFINAFGAYATAYALVEANMNLVTLKIVSQFSDVSYDPGLANALSLLVVVVATGFVVLYRVSLNRIERPPK
jgi:putative spermidine/putrescine transport system permease protein